MKVLVSGKQKYRYVVEKNYDNYQFNYFSDIGELTELISHMPQNEKIVVFVGSIRQGEKLKEAFEKEGEKVDFLTAENKEVEASDVVKNLTIFQKFLGRILIATSVLDVGVSICDKAVTMVAIIAYDKCTFKQMLGRIRLEEDEEIKVLIPQQNAKKFARKIAKYLKNEVEFVLKIVQMEDSTEISRYVTYALDHGIATWQTIRKFIIFSADGEKRLNYLACTQTLHLYSEFTENVKFLERDSDFYVKKQLSWLGKEFEFQINDYISEEVREHKKQEVIEKIRRIANVNLGEQNFETIRKILVDLHAIIRVLDKGLVRGNTTLSVKKFNNVMKEQNMPFVIKTRKDGRKTIYELQEKLVNEQKAT